MEAIKFITQWVAYMFIIIPVGTATMITYHALRKSLSTDEAELGECDNKIKQTLKGAIVALTISGLIQIVKSFYL